ncbi:uncharacterized protein LOC144449613 [Glandiceps talaboti]
MLRRILFIFQRVSSYSRPEPIEVTLNYIDNHTVSVEWQVIQESGYPVEFVEMKYRQLSPNTTNWIMLPPVYYKDEQQASYKLTNLESDGQYQLLIWAVNMVGPGAVNIVEFTTQSSKWEAVTKSPLKRSRMPKSVSVLFIGIGSLISIAMFIFLCLVVTCFFQKAYHRLRDDVTLFDDNRIYSGGGIDNPLYGVDDDNVVPLTHFDVKQH